MSKAKEVLTTGEVAKLCNVAPRTVSKWFDSGQLRGYRIPGSKDRRIPLQQLIRFMKAHGMPLEGLESGQTRVLIVDNEDELTELLQSTLSKRHDYDVQVAASAFEAGAVLEQFRPHVILVDIDLAGIEGRTMSRFIASRAEFQDIQLVAMSASMTQSDRQLLRQEGYSNCLSKPFNIQQVADVIEETLTVGA